MIKLYAVSNKYAYLNRHFANNKNKTKTKQKQKKAKSKLNALIFFGFCIARVTFRGVSAVDACRKLDEALVSTIV